MTPVPSARSFGDLALIAVGAVLIVVGLPIFITAAWSLLRDTAPHVVVRDAFGGDSPFHVFVGVGLIASGTLLLLRRPEGGWVYAGVFLVILAWTSWEAGWDSRLFLRRVLGPTVLGLVLLCFVPVLRRWAVLQKRSILSPVTALLIIAGVVLAAFGVEFGATRVLE